MAKQTINDCKDLQKKRQHQIYMTHSDDEIKRNAFVKGMREISERDRDEAARARKEICAELGGLKKAQYYVRQGGGVTHTRAERRGIELVFRKHKVTAPWGL